MASEIRTNSLTSRAGLSTVTLTDSGPMFSGITTFVDNSTFSVGTGGTIHAPATNTLNIGVNNTESLRIDSSSNLKIAGVCTATHFYGSGANLTGIPQTTINNNATTKFITGTNNANELDCEANLSYNNNLVTFSSSSLMVDKGSNATVSVKETSGNKEAQFRANTDGGLLRTIGNYPLILGTNQTERLRIDSSGRVSIGDNNTQTSYPFYVAKDLNSGGNLLSFGNTDSTYSQSLTLSFDSNKDMKWAGGSGSGGIIWDVGTRAHSFKISGTEVFRTQVSGSYGTVETRSANGGYGGYSIVNGANYVFMGDGSGAGIFNDTDNQWLIYGDKGGDTFLYSGGTQTLRSYVTGDYGTIQTLATKNGWGGLSIAGQYVFMADGSNAGLFNDIDNEWMFYFARNGGFHFYHDNTLYLNSVGGKIQMVQDCRLESKANSTWGVGVMFGGNGYGGSSTHGSCAMTNGNFHIDARAGGYGMYLNWYAGTSGTYFGNGASGQAGRIDSSGNLSLSGSYPGSDLRLKENIQTITGATDTIKSLVGKTFTWKAGAGLDSYKHYGFIAQEVQKVVPDLVKDIGCHYFDKDDKLVTDIDPTESDEDRKNKGLTQSLTVNNEGVTPILVEAMKELITKVETLEQENIALRARVTNLEGE